MGILTRGSSPPLSTPSYSVLFAKAQGTTKVGHTSSRSNTIPSVLFVPAILVDIGKGSFALVIFVEDSAGLVLKQVVPRMTLGRRPYNPLARCS